MEISELTDLWGICLFQAGFSRYPLPFSLHGSGLNEFLWLPLTDKIAACYAAVCLADSPQADSFVDVHKAEHTVLFFYHSVPLVEGR